MKKYGSHVPAFAICGLALFSVTYSCPMFVEFYPDPKEISDAEGEYVEIRLDDFRAESLFVRMESKEILAFAWPDAERLVLVHDTVSCPVWKNVACGLLGKTSLPNSRESVWYVWSGACMDSVTLPQPKPGKSVQRVGLTDEWAFVEGTKGSADPDYEFGIEDCALGRLSAEFADGLWNVTAFLAGCDSSSVHVRTLDVFGAGGWMDKDSVVRDGFSVVRPGGGALWFHAELPEDAAPSNNVLDTLFVVRSGAGSAARESNGSLAESPGRFSGMSPVRVTEVHHCPEEPMPEWVEIYNASSFPLPLDAFRFCDRGSALGRAGDSILPFQTVLVCKDTMALRTSLGIPDIRMVQVPLGFLNNVEGTLRLCYRNDALDSVYWDKGTVACPSGFNPLTGRREFTPGFQRKSVKKEMSKRFFEYKLSSRVVSKKGAALRLYVESEHDVVLGLLDSAGRRVWKAVVPSMSNGWVRVPVQEHLGIGAGYVTLSVGESEDVVGILVRP